MENIVHPHKQKMSPGLSFEIKLHGFLLWGSVGFLMPLAILIKRTTPNGHESGVRLRIIYYVHAITQILSVLLATAGAVLSIKYFDNSFSNDHQRIGLAFYILMWMQTFIGIFRPQRGSRGRSICFISHWVIGIGVAVLGVINIYTGLRAYNNRTSNNVRAWTVVFTVEVSLILFVYLLQEKWHYIREQGTRHNSRKYTGVQPERSNISTFLRNMNLRHNQQFISSCYRARVKSTNSLL